MKVKALFLVVVLLFLCSCAAKPEISDSTYGGLPCPIPAASWGMSKEECFAALSLSADEVTAKAGSEGEGSYSILLPEQIEVYGSPATVQLLFYDNMLGLSPGLTLIRLDFGKEIDKTTLEERITAALGSSAQKRDGGGWETLQNRGNLPKEVVEQYFSQMLDLPDEAMPLGRAGFSSFYEKLNGSVVLEINNTNAVIGAKGLEKK